MVGHFEVCLEAVRFGVPDICSVEEGTEKEEGQDGDNSCVQKCISIL